jgi:exosortase family protein XrtF
MNTDLLKTPVARFLIKALLLYAAWFLVYELWLHPRQTLDLWVIDITIAMSKWILELLGYTVFTGSERLIGIDGVPGLWVGDNCNGLVLFALFTGFVIAYPGPVMRKLVYIPVGILILQILNVIRIVVLAIIQTYSLEMTQFNHTYTFTIIIYGTIFGLWMYWVNRLSGHSLSGLK